MVHFCIVAQACTIFGAAKVRRINSIRCKLPHCTQSALAAFCKLAKNTELPDITHRREIRDVAASKTSYGPLLHMLELKIVQNKTIQLEVANPLALLYIAAQTCWFGKLLQATYEKYPCSHHSPWKLCIYEDEAKPGNKMKRDNRRACQNIYVSFFDFGGAALSKEDFLLQVQL